MEAAEFMTLNELEALANAVYSPTADDWELKIAQVRFDCAANPQTIKQLIALCRMQQKRVKTAQNNLASSRPRGSSDPDSPNYDHGAFMWDYYGEAIAAFEEFNQAVTPDLRHASSRT